MLKRLCRSVGNTANPTIGGWPPSRDGRGRPDSASVERFGTRYTGRIRLENCPTSARRRMLSHVFRRNTALSQPTRKRRCDDEACGHREGSPYREELDHGDDQHDASPRAKPGSAIIGCVPGRRRDAETMWACGASLGIEFSFSACWLAINDRLGTRPGRRQFGPGRTSQCLPPHRTARRSSRCGSRSRRRTPRPLCCPRPVSRTKGFARSAPC
jgi:hypothetical protein